MQPLTEYLSKGGPAMIPLGVVAAWLYYSIMRYALLRLHQPVMGDEYGYPLRDLSGMRQSLERVRQQLRLIRVLTYILPLLGLLGTVMGMVTTFNGLSEVGSSVAATQSGVSSGIAEALLSTQTGLVFAIPALVFQAFMQRHHSKLLTACHILFLEAEQNA